MPSDRKQDRHPRRRAEPDRAGDRVRLLLLPRLLRARRSRLRDDHGQLQPGDGEHRLRHLRPALFRAADRRGRARDPARRACPNGELRRRDRPVRRADPAQAGRRRWRMRASRSSAPRPTRSTLPRTASASPRWSSKLGLKQPRNGIARSRDEAVAVAERDRLSGADAAVLRARRARDGDRRQPAAARRLYRRPRCRSRATRPVLIDQYLRDAIEVDVDALCRRRPTSPSRA